MHSGELGRFVADKRCLKSFKMEGCSSLGSFSLCSSSLGTLWLSDLCSLSKMVISRLFISYNNYLCWKSKFAHSFAILTGFQLP